MRHSASMSSPAYRNLHKLIKLKIIFYNETNALKIQNSFQNVLSTKCIIHVKIESIPIPWPAANSSLFMHDISLDQEKNILPYIFLSHKNVIVVTSLLGIWSGVILST